LPETKKGTDLTPPLLIAVFSWSRRQAAPSENSTRALTGRIF
jgi:hypothetical protein